MYSIKQSIPQLLTITVKENIPVLTGTVISQPYYLSIKDYKELYNTTNGIIDTLNLINSYAYVINFSSTETLSSSIDQLIENNFICIEKANDKPVSGNLDILTKFKLNGYIYQYNDINEGNIEVNGKFISGTLSSFVTTFNNQTGNVNGISGLIINGELLNTNNGLVEITGLIPKNSYIKSINKDNSNFDKTKILSTVIINNNKFITNNDKQIEINDYITGKTSTSALLTEDFTLVNIDQNNQYSAVNVSYLNQHNSDLIRTRLLPSGFTIFELPTNYYPLHFYSQENGNLCYIKWSITGNKVTIPSSDHNLIITLIKVDQNV